MGFCVAAFVVALINRVVRDPWNYVNVFSIFYAVAIAGGQISFAIILEGKYLPSEETLAILFLAWWAFLGGSLLKLNGVTPIGKITKITKIKKSNSWRVLFFLIFANLIYNLAILHVSGAYDVFVHGGVGLVDALASTRIANSGDPSKGHVGWYFELWHTAYLYYVPLSLYMRRMGYVSKKFVVIVVLLGVFSSLILFSRIQLLMLLVVTFVSWTILFRPSPRVVLMRVAAVFLAAFLLFFAMQIFISNNEVLQSTSTLSERVITYAFGPILAYQELLRGGYDEANPRGALYSLQAMYYFAGKLGLLDASEYPVGYREYVFDPFPTNVYTFLDAFTLDFGPVGAVVGAFLLGVFVATVYRRLCSAVGFSTLLMYALCVYGSSVAMLTNTFIQHVFFIQIATILGIQAMLSVVVSSRGGIVSNLRHYSNSDSVVKII